MKKFKKTKKERDYSRKRKLDWGCNSRVEGFKPHVCGPSFHLLEKNKIQPHGVA